MKINCIITAVLLCAGATQTIGAVVFSNPITGTSVNTFNPYTTGQTVHANVTVSGIGRGSGVNAASATDRYSATSWTTAAVLDGNDYFTFTITPASGFMVSFSSFVYNSQRSATGPTSSAFRTSRDSFAANVGSPTVGAAGVATKNTINLSGAAYQNLTTATEFRLYGFSAGAGTGTFSVNDFTFNGTVSAVPEPSEYAGLAGAGLIGFALWRRRAARKA